MGALSLAPIFAFHFVTHFVATFVFFVVLSPFLVSSTVPPPDGSGRLMYAL